MQFTPFSGSYRKVLIPRFVYGDLGLRIYVAWLIRRLAFTLSMIGARISELGLCLAPMVNASAKD
jgi:hypothetical protein